MHKEMFKIIKEEIITERLKRFKVYVSGESQPLILMGKNEREKCLVLKGFKPRIRIHT